MSDTKDKVLYMLSSSAQIGSTLNTIRQLVNSVRPNSNIEVTSPDVMALQEDNEALRRNNKELLDQRFQFMDEIALLRHEKAMSSIMSGHYKSEFDIHTKESETFVKEATDKIKVLQAQLAKCKEQREYLRRNYTGYWGESSEVQARINEATKEHDKELDSIGS